VEGLATIKPSELANKLFAVRILQPSYADFIVECEKAVEDGESTCSSAQQQTLTPGFNGAQEDAAEEDAIEQDAAGEDAIEEDAIEEDAVEENVAEEDHIEFRSQAANAPFASSDSGQPAHRPSFFSRLIARSNHATNLPSPNPDEDVTEEPTRPAPHPELPRECIPAISSFLIVLGPRRSDFLTYSEFRRAVDNYAEARPDDISAKAHSLRLQERNEKKKEKNKRQKTARRDQKKQRRAEMRLQRDRAYVDEYRPGQ
jgi:hypothetical protein